MGLFAGDYYVFVHGICPPLGLVASSEGQEGSPGPGDDTVTGEGCEWVVQDIILAVTFLRVKHPPIGARRMIGNEWQLSLQHISTLPYFGPLSGVRD